VVSVRVFENGEPVFIASLVKTSERIKPGADRVAIVCPVKTLRWSTESRYESIIVKCAAPASIFARLKRSSGAGKQKPGDVTGTRPSGSPI